MFAVGVPRARTDTKDATANGERADEDESNGNKEDDCCHDANRFEHLYDKTCEYSMFASSAEDIVPALFAWQTGR